MSEPETLERVSETLDLALLRYEQRNYSAAKKLTRDAKARLDLAREANDG